MSDSSEAVGTAEIYDAYGNLAQDYPSSSAPSFGYAGGHRYYAESIGLDHLKARYYSPTWSRFVSRDPIGYRGGQNLYEYAEDDPVNLVDAARLNASSGDGWDCTANYHECMKDVDATVRDCACSFWNSGTVIGGSIGGIGAGGVGLLCPLCGIAIGAGDAIGAIAGVTVGMDSCTNLRKEYTKSCDDAYEWCRSHTTSPAR